jgi:hypothetical protein
MFAYPDVLILLIFNGTCNAIMYGITASLSVIFEDVYPHLTLTDIGLCFMALGGGTLVGSWLSGKLTNSCYRKAREDLIRQTPSHAEKDRDIDAKAFEKDPTFPIEKARLQVLPCITLVYSVCVVGSPIEGYYRGTANPAIHQSVHFSYSAVRQDLTTSPTVGLTVVVIMNTIQTLLVDLVPDQGSSITACVRTTPLPTMLTYSKVSPLPTEQHRPLLYRRWHGVCHQPHPRLPLHANLSFVVRRNPVGTRLARAAATKAVATARLDRR